MAADANIFHSLLRPVRSVAEYGDDMDRREINQLQLVGQRRQNDLSAITMQQQVATAQQAQARQNAIQALVSRFTDPAQLESAALAGPDTYEFGKQRRADRLDAEEKAAKIESQRATAGKTSGEAAAARRAEAIQHVGSFASPDDALASLQTATDIPPQLRDELIRSMPRDPLKFREWQLRVVLSLATPQQQAEGMAPKVAMTNAGGAFVPTNTNPLAGPVGAVQGAAPVPITQSADNRATVGASLANAAAMRDQAQATRDAASTQRDQATEMKLADDYRAQSKEFGQALSAHKQLSSTLGSATSSPAATLAAATKFMKILDPGSVVRESELGMALAASGVLDRAMNYVSTLQSGQKLTPTQAKDFKVISDKMFTAAQQVQQAIDADYKGKAKAYKLRPEMVVQDIGQNASTINFADLK